LKEISEIAASGQQPAVSKGGYCIVGGNWDSGLFALRR
jgi:hypothetical protein